MKELKRLVTTVAGACLLTTGAFAQSGSWTNQADSVWSAPTNWLNAIVADGSGNTANFSTIDSTVTNTIILDSSRTLGNLSFGDTDTNSPATWIVTTNTPGGQTLTLAGGTPTLTVGVLAPDNFAEIRTPIVGTAGLTKAGAGELRLTGINPVTGPINVNSGRLYLAGGNFTGGTLPGTITNFVSNGSTLSMGNSVTNLFVPAGQTGNLEQRTGSTASGLGGGANSILNIVVQNTGGTVTAGGSWAKGGSLTTLNVNSTGGNIGFFRLRPNGSAFDSLVSLSNTVVNLDRVNMFAVGNSGGNTYNFGAINGTTNAVWRGAQNGAANYFVGSLNQNMLFEGAMVDEAVGFSGFNLIKLGTGVLTLSGTNITYGGDAEATVARRGGFTTINAGTLALTNGASLGRGVVNAGVEYFADITVNTNGTYELTGTTNNSTSPLTIVRGAGKIKGNYVHDEGILTPGTDLSARTMTFLNNLTITNNPSIDPNTLVPYAAVSSNSVIRFDISPSLTSGNDLINVSGQALVDGNPDLEVNFLGGASPGSYVLINATNGVVGNPSTWNVKWGGRGAAPTVTATANQVLLNVSLGGAASLVWQGFTNAIWDVNTTSNWLNGAAVDKYFQLDSVTFNESAPLQSAITLNTIATPASITVSNDGTSYAITGSGQIGGGGSLTKRGVGLLTLNTANTYAGGTTISDGGTIDIGGIATALGTGTLTMNDGKLQSTIGSGTLTLATPIAFGANTTNILQPDGAGNTLFSGNFTGPSSARIVMQSAQVPKGADFDGDKTGFTGTIEFTSQVVLRFRTLASAGTSAIRWELGEAGGTLGSLGTGTPRTFTLGSVNGGTPAVLGGHESGGGGLGSDVTWEIGSLNLNNTFAGTIRNGNQNGGSNATSVVKVGTGTLTLSGANTYSGNTTVSNGTLAVTTPNTIPNASTVAIVNPGVVNLNFTGTNYVRGLVINGVTQPNGTYGASGSGAATIDNTHFTGTGVLWVGAPPQASLGSIFDGVQLTLDWPLGQGWRLQAQTNSLDSGIGNTWFNVTGATPPYVIAFDPVNPTVFFRLVYP